MLFIYSLGQRKLQTYQELEAVLAKWGIMLLKGKMEDQTARKMEKGKQTFEWKNIA